MIRIPVLAATSAKLTSQTPPTAARARTAGCCHWLAPKTAHGPPKPCQDLTQSTATQQLGTTTRAATARHRADRRTQQAPGRRAYAGPQRAEHGDDKQQPRAQIR